MKKEERRLMLIFVNTFAKFSKNIDCASDAYTENMELNEV